MSQMNTRLIISAEDRGATKLLRKMGAEVDATVDHFGRLGSSIAAALGGMTAGFGIKKAMEFIDDYKMDVLSVATMLTDTWRGSGRDMKQVFEQNTRYAENFFDVLRKQSMKSISTFTDLRNAFTIFTSKGLALDATEAQVATLANLVDRIVLATAGQNRNIQVLQEMRAMLEGRARTTDVVAKLFIERDPNFQATLKRLVSEGSGAGVVDYLGGLVADIPIAESLGSNLRIQMQKLKDMMGLWAKDTFMPLYDTLAKMASDAADAIGGDSPLLKGIQGITDGMTKALRASVGLFSKFSQSGFGKFLLEAAPQLLAISSAAVIAARSLALLKAATLSLTTGGGLAVLAATGLAVGSQWAGRQETREQVASRTEAGGYTGGDDLWAYFKSFLADMAQGFLAWGKGALSLVANTVKFIAETIGNMAKSLIVTAAETWESIKGNFYNLSAKIMSGFDSVTSGISNIFLKIYYGFLKAMEWVKHPFSEKARSAGVAGISAEEKTALDTPAKTMFSGWVDAMEKSAVESDKAVVRIREGYAEISTRQENAWEYFKANLWMPGEIMLNQWDAWQKQRAGGGGTGGLTLNNGADVGKGSQAKNDAVAAEMAKAMQKSIASLTKNSAGLDAVMADMTAATLKGGDSLQYALAQVEREYARYKAKIVKFTGEQENSVAALIAEQGLLKKEIALSAGAERDVLQAKLSMFDSSIGLARVEQALLAEREVQAELEKKITEAKGEEAKALQEQLKESRQKASDLLKAQEAELKAVNAAKGAVAGKLADLYRDAQATAKTIAEADRIEDRLHGLFSTFAGLPGKTGAGGVQAQKTLESMQMQKQLADFNEKFDQGASAESLAMAQERLNGLQAQYLELYKATSEEMEVQIGKAGRMADLAADGGVFAGLQAGMIDFADGMSDTFASIRDLTTDTFSAMRDTMGSMFFDFFSGELDSAKDYFAAFGRSILQSFSDMLAKMVAEYIAKTMAMQAVGGILSGVFGAVGGLFGGIGNLASGAATTQLGGVHASQAVTLTAADGGIFPGGFKAFAAGGIVSQPTFGLVGEGRYNEAVVPLPDGRTIPVSMRGGGGGVTVNVIDNTGGEVRKTVERRADENGEAIIDIILDRISRNTKGARAQLRGALGVS